MKKRIFVVALIGVVLLCAMMMSTSALSAQAKSEQITIKVEGATVHEEPNAESRVIAEAALGSVYDVVRKTGEWYEVKVPSRFGMTKTGYIYEKFLNTEEPAVEPQPSDTLVSEPIVAKPAVVGRKAYFSLSGLYHRQEGYTFELSYLHADEIATFYDLAGDTDMFGLRLGAGYFVRDNIEIALGIQYSRATLEGLYAMALPSDSLLGDLAYADEPISHTISEIAIDLGLNLHVLKKGPLSPYLGSGVVYINGKIEMVKGFSTSDTYYADRTHAIAVSDPEFSEEAISSFGFYGKAGIDITIAERVAIFSEGQYLYAKEEIPHPYGATVIGKDDPVEIDLGGISALLGVKIRF